MFNEAQTQQAGYAANQKAADPYDIHRQAVAEWRACCERYAQAANAKEAASQVMQKATTQLAEFLQGFTQDPTVPAPCPPNGGLAGASIPRPY